MHQLNGSVSRSYSFNQKWQSACLFYFVFFRVGVFSPGLSAFAVFGHLYRWHFCRRAGSCVLRRVCVQCVCFAVRCYRVCAQRDAAVLALQCLHSSTCTPVLALQCLHSSVCTAIYAATPKPAVSFLVPQQEGLFLANAARSQSMRCAPRSCSDTRYPRNRAKIRSSETRVVHLAARKRETGTKQRFLKYI